MQSQEDPPRYLRNVPAFQDLRIGSQMRRPSSRHHRRPSSEYHSDAYDSLKTPQTHVVEITASTQSNLLQHHSVGNAWSTGDAIYRKAISGQRDVLQTQGVMDSSKETMMNQPCRRTAILKELWFPLCCIHGSMLLILGTLAILVSVYRVEPQRGLFLDPAGSSYDGQKAYLLLSIPATWLTFVTGRATQFASLLAGSIMQLWGWRTAQSIVEASNRPGAEELPTPYQLSLLIGLLLASPNRLRRYVSYRCYRKQRKKAPHSPKLLLRAGLMLSLCFVMASLMFVADTLVHYTTQTVLFDQVTVDRSHQTSGRGLSAECLSLKRADNFGFPCSINNLISPNAYLAEQNEMLFLSHNTSKQSEIRLIDSELGNIAVLLPKTQDLSPYVDYRASTIGISTQCKPITPSCNFGVWGPKDLYSGFFCSPQFWGSLGVSNSNASVPGIDYPALAFRLGPNMLMAFFTDESLSQLYNPFGYDLKTGASDPDIPLMPDDQLLNQLHVAFAVRFAATNILANADFALDAGFFKGPNSVYDSVISCSYRSWLVEYTWFNGTIQNVQATSAPNGTISEIWHGSQISSSVSGTDPTLEAMLDQAAVMNSSIAFAQTWADLYSPVIMATIGGVSSSRSNVLQQTRVPVLVVQVLIPALAFLAWCCLTYIAAGCVLAAFAVRTASRGDIRDAKARLSLFGLVTWAVASDLLQRNEDVGEVLPGEQNIEEESEKVGLLQSSLNSFDFGIIPASTRANASRD